MTDDAAARKALRRDHKRSLKRAGEIRPPFGKAVAAEREGFFLGAGAFTQLVLADSVAGCYLVSTSDLKVGRSLFRRGVRGEQTQIARALGVLDAVQQRDRLRGSTFLEVGGNIGTSCITALLAHEFADAITLEPSPVNCRVLRANAALNGLHDRIRVVPVAASSTDGNARLLLSGVSSGGHRLLASNEQSRKMTELVRTVRLDTLVDEGVIDPERVGMLFMDAQGHEGQVLAGASSLLGLGMPVVLEYKPASLRMTNSLELIHSTISQHYTHVVDLTRVPVDAPNEFHSEDVGRMHELASRYEGQAFTDILMFR